MTSFDRPRTFTAGQFKVVMWPRAMVELEVPDYALSVKEPVKTRFDREELHDLIYVLTRALKTVEAQND